MINANEAIKMTSTNIEELTTKELSEIENEITIAIRRGQYSISRSGCLKEYTRDILKRLGYKVETGTQYNESWYSISWR